MSTANSGATRDAQLAAMLAAPPPRALPPELRRIALRQAAPLSFGIFGALFGGFGLIFVWIFFPSHIVQDSQLLAFDTVQAPGTIIATAETHLSINQKRVMLYAFEFRTPAGALRRGECFTTGQRWQVGDTVDVQYRAEEPSIACPTEARLSRTSWATSFVILFPLGGIGLILWVTLSRRRMLNTFSHGRVLEAFVTDIEHTQTMIDDYPLYKITFEREDAPQDPPIILRHWKPKVVAFLQVRRETKLPVSLLADRRKPAHFLLPETL